MAVCTEHCSHCVPFLFEEAIAFFLELLSSGDDINHHRGAYWMGLSSWRTYAHTVSADISSTRLNICPFRIHSQIGRGALLLMMIELYTATASLCSDRPHTGHKTHTQLIIKWKTHRWATDESALEEMKHVSIPSLGRAHIGFPYFSVVCRFLVHVLMISAAYD